jgi:hypothetical protein
MAKLLSGTRVYGNTTIYTYLTLGSNVSISGANAATSNITGALTVAGGAGIRGNVYTGSVILTGSGNTITFSDGTIQSTAASAGPYANAAFGVANSASSYANGAFAAANNAGSTANLVIAWNTANAASSYANSAYVTANSAASYANSAFIKANTANTLAQAAYDAANNATDTWVRTAANSASSYANSAYNAANSAGSYANSAYNAANNATDTWVRTAANSASSYANGAFNQANTANTLAQSAYDKANTGGGNSFTVIATTPGSGYSNIIATASDSVLTITGESGIVVGLDPTTNKIVIGNMYVGAQDITLDYGTLDYFTDAIRYDYGFVS